jgi:hypothetical protein
VLRAIARLLLVPLALATLAPAASAATALPATPAAPALFDAPALSDAELASQRGGFELPNGIDVALAATMTTSVDGAPVLTTTFTIVGDSASVTTDGVLATVNAVVPASAGAGAGQASAPPTITVSIAKPAAATPAAAAPAAAAPPAPAPQIAQAAGAGTIPAAPPAPVTQLLAAGGTMAATAVLDNLRITHLVGDHLGTFVANGGDGRVIDQGLTLDLTLGNVAPLMIGSSLARIQDLGVDASIWHSMGG